MTPSTETNFRHNIRPLSIFSFCGQPIVRRRDEYQLATKELPPCPECKRARDKAALALGGKYRRLG
jgi:hypothetical protein